MSKLSRTNVVRAISVSPSDALSGFSLLYIGVNLVVYKLNVTGAVDVR